MRKKISVPKHFALVVSVAVGLSNAQTHLVAQPTFSEHGATVLGGANFESRSASLADIDNDGDLDLLFQGSTYPSAFAAQRLFRNNIVGAGTMTYTEITNKYPTADIGPSWSAAWGDYDGDGYVDVFVGQSNIGASGDVLKNFAGTGFTNRSTTTGLNDPGFHQNVAWNDIDNDHDLDLIIGMEGPEKHEIYLQSANGTFQPVGASVGFQQAYGTKGYGMAIGDTDGDGDLDVYISTCIGTNNLRNNFYENQLAETGSLGFIDIADTNGTQFMTNSYGAEFLDFDDDGDLDLFLVGADQEPSKIYRNDGGNQFTDVDTITGHALLSDVSGDLNGGRAVDYDNDGDLDLFFHDHLSQGSANAARKLYRNDGNWQFTDVTNLEGLGAINEGAYDSTWGDIDLDGDQDLIAPTDSRFDERVFLSDASENGNHWLYVRLNGTSDNTTAIGASLYATINEGTTEERTLRREANTNAGTFNQSDLPVHFGLGSATSIDELRIRWPDGTFQTLTDIAVDQYLTINLPGDFDGDGDVDADDMTLWQSSHGQNALADADLDGDSDGADFLIWQQHAGLGTATGTIAWAVPEPAGIVLSAMAFLSWGCGRTRTRRVARNIRRELNAAG